jgi:outer membrane lipoprotein-sorting protein
MKKLLLTVICLFAVIIINAQSLEEIIGKYTVANKLDKISEFKTIKITAKTSMMGMEMPMVIWMKNPNMIKTVTSVNGQDIIQAFDGEKGYMVNPMAGSNDPVEMNAEQIKDVVRNNIFQNYMATYLKNGKLALEGEEIVNGKPAFKVKADIDGTNKAYMYIDKSTFLLIKTVADINQGGMAMTVESYPTDYTETSGVFLPMKTTTNASGMEMVTTFSKVEVDIPIEDSIFKIK